MQIILNHSSMQPIYDQLLRQIKAEIAAGHLTAGFPHSFPNLIHQSPIRKYFFQSTHAFASKPFVLTS